jgi:hypothetical protein
MFILIDDERNVPEVARMLPHITIDESKIFFDTVYRTFEEAIDKSNTISNKDTVFLDHDLGTDVVGDDGHGVITHMFNNNIYPKMIYIVSANPIGYRKMEKVILNDMKYTKITDRVYKKD